MPTVLTFGARNLGAGITEHFAGQGWDVAAVARSQETVDKLGERVPSALGIVGDVTHPDQVAESAFAAHERFGSLDLIVNAASPGRRPPGPFGGGPLLEATPEAVEAYAIDVVRMAYSFLSAGSRSLKELSGGGTLIQITGGSSRRALPGKGPWAAGAFGTRALAQSAAQELRPDGIHAALLIVDAVIRRPDSDPSDELAEEEDVARAVDYLASQAPTAWTHELVVTPKGDTWTP